MKRILFSPIGTTDPISNFRDGAMIHICRYIDIDKVYLYLSKEVYGYHKHDNRYIYCLEKLSEIKGKKIDYEIIAREDLENVHIFDFFIDEFRDILKKIDNENEESELYVNVSSGTPAMKSALQSLAAFQEIKMIPVQVSTPERKSNPHAEEKWDYRPEEMWECNEDNSDHKERLSISKNFNFLVQIKKKMLEELIKKYDYVGAQTLAESMSDCLGEKFTDLLDGACKRNRFDYKSANNIYKKYGIKLLEHEQSNVAAISEYLLLLDLKVKRGELADFIRAITPILLDIFRVILKDYYGIDIENYISNKKDGKKWSEIKLESSDEGREIKTILNKSYGNGFRFDSAVYSDHLLNIIKYKAPDSELYKKCNELRTIEGKMRNPAAHEMVKIDNESIKKEFGITAQGIVNRINVILNFTSIKTNEDFFLSYDRMNDVLIKYMNS